MVTLLRRCAIVLLFCCAAPSGPAIAQPNPLAAARLELRVVPQVGDPGVGTGVTDLAGTAHNQLLLADAARKRRFEIQYRVTGLPTAGGVEFDGLQLASIDVIASVNGGNTGVTLGRALLSVNESGGAGATGVGVPPGTNDTSAVSPNAARGLHRPFRGVIPAPPPNNDYGANGVLRPGGRLIDDITAVTLSGSGQSETDGMGNLRWYGLYSFEADFGVGGTDQNADGFVEVAFDAQLFVSASDGIAWYGFVAGDPRAYGSPLRTDSRATVSVQIPGVGTLGVFGMGLGVMVRRRQRTR